MQHVRPRPVRSTRAAAAAYAQPAPDLEDSSLYFNRELSWLDFNDRVLQLAEDASVPLLERVKFCAIWESNLDEFFMVRVANLHDQLEAGVDARGADGMSAGDQIDAIHELVLGQRDRLDAMLRARASPGARRARDPDHLARARERPRARAARPGVREEHLSGADPAGDRPRPPLPLHLEPLPQPGRHAPRPRPGHRGARPGEGAEGAAREVRRDRRVGGRRWSRSRI